MTKAASVIEKLSVSWRTVNNRMKNVGLLRSESLVNRTSSQLSNLAKLTNDKISKTVDSFANVHSQSDILRKGRELNHEVGIRADLKEAKKDIKNKNFRKYIK